MLVEYDLLGTKKPNSKNTFMIVRKIELHTGEPISNVHLSLIRNGVITFNEGVFYKWCPLECDFIPASGFNKDGRGVLGLSKYSKAGMKRKKRIKSCGVPSKVTDGGFYYKIACPKTHLTRTRLSED